MLPGPEIEFSKLAGLRLNFLPNPGPYFFPLAALEQVETLDMGGLVEQMSLAGLHEASHSFCQYGTYLKNVHALGVDVSGYSAPILIWVVPTKNSQPALHQVVQLLEENKGRTGVSPAH